MLGVVESDFVRTTEIAELFGVSRQRVQRLSRQADFPGPVLEVGRMKLWRRSDVEEWGLGHSVELRPQNAHRAEWQTELEGELARRLRMLLESIVEHVGESMKQNIYVWLRPEERSLRVLATDSYAVLLTSVRVLVTVEGPRAWICVDPRELLHALLLGTAASTLGIAYATGDHGTGGKGRKRGNDSELRIWRGGEQVKEIGDEGRTIRRVAVLDDRERLSATGDERPRTRAELRESFVALFAQAPEADSQQNEATIGDYGMAFLERWWRALRDPEKPSDLRVKVTGPGSQVLVSARHGEDLHFRGIFMAMPEEPSTS